MERYFIAFRKKMVVILSLAIIFCITGTLIIVRSRVDNENANAMSCNPSASTISDAVCLQDMKAGMTAEMTVGSGYTLKDSRDGQEYTITKLADGNVWMIDNLNLGAVSLTQDLTSANTNLTTTITAAAFNEWKKTSGSNTSTAPEYITVSGTDSTSGTLYGTLYNYCATSAQTICTDSNSNNATSDLCPAGWRLPTDGEFRYMYSNYKNKMRAPIDSGGAAFALAGYFSNSVPSIPMYQDSEGDYWSSTRESNRGMYNLSLIASNADPADSNIRSRGFSIRCMFNVLSMQDATVESLSAAMPNEGDSTVLRDVRDYKTYKITKIAGAYWMTQNLRYVGDAGSTSGSMTIKSATTNVSTDKTLTYYSLDSSDSSYTDHCESTNSYTYPCAKAGKDDNNNDTVWYNYAAASAGTITGSSNSTDATQDICPKGWKLPPYSGTGSISSITSYKDAFSPVYGGYYDNGSLDYASTYGFWWSATANNTIRRYVLYYNGGSLNTSDYDPRHSGYYVRCVSSISAPVKTSLTATATASNKTYDGNTSASVSITFKNGSTTVNLTKDTDYTIDSAVFTNASAGTNKTVTIKLTLKGNAASNYDFSGSNTTTITTTATINKASSGNPPEMTENLSAAVGTKLSNVKSSYTQGFSWSNSNTTVTAGTNSYPATYIKNGDSTNYTASSISVPVTGQKVSLTATATASNKTYDGNTNASVSVTFKNGSTTVNLTKDTDYTIDSAVFTNASAGTNKTVTIKLTLKGNAASNYDFSGSNTTTITTTATINKASSPTTVSELTANLKTTTGVKLSTVALTTPGLSWTSPNTTVQSGSHTYSATYIKNDDSTNYNSVTINIPIEGVDEKAPAVTVDGGNGSVTTSGVATPGEQITVVFKPDEDYAVGTVTIDGQNVTDQVKKDTIVTTAGDTAPNIVVTFRPTTNAIIDGADQTYHKDGSTETQSNGLSFRFDINYEKFKRVGKVYVNNQLLDKGYYTSESGSTIITLSRSYLDTLPQGNNILAVVLEDTPVSTTSFAVAGSDTPTPIDVNEGREITPDRENEEGSSAVPDTGRFTGAAAGAVAGVIILPAILGVAYYLKRRKGTSRIKNCLK